MNLGEGCHQCNVIHTCTPGERWMQLRSCPKIFWVIANLLGYPMGSPGKVYCVSLEIESN